MNDKRKSEKITVTARNALNEQAEGLSSDNQHRLRLAREKALAQATKSSWLSWKWFSGAGAGVALASVIAFMIVPNLQTSHDAISPFDDLELLTADVDLDLVYQLDVYQCLY